MLLVQIIAILEPAFVDLFSFNRYYNNCGKDSIISKGDVPAKKTIGDIKELVLIPQ